jgi:hypothetical protein
MTAGFSDAFRELLKLSIEQSRRAFETFMTISENAWLVPQAGLPHTYDLSPLGDKIREAFRVNAAAHFAVALRLADSRDATEAMRLYAEHVEERIETVSRQFQEISSLVAQMVAANKSEQFEDISGVAKAAKNKDVPSASRHGPDASRNGKVAAQFSRKEVNGALPPPAGMDSPKSLHPAQSTSPSHNQRADALSDRQKGKKRQNFQKAARSSRGKRQPQPSGK